MTNLPFYLATITAPIPLIHLWLHGMRTWWIKRPRIFFGFAILLWILSFFFFSYIDRSFLSQFNPSFELQLIGWILLILGGGLIFYSLFTLGWRRFFLLAVFYPHITPQIHIKKGLFSFFPHPAYAGYLILLLGGILLSGKIYLSLIFIISLILTPLVIFFEEEELKERTG